MQGTTYGIKIAVGENPALYEVAIEADERLRRALHLMETPVSVTNA